MLWPGKNAWPQSKQKSGRWSGEYALGHRKDSAAAAGRSIKASPEPPYTQPGGSGADIPEMSAPEYIAAKQLVKSADVDYCRRLHATVMAMLGNAKKMVSW